MDFKLYRAETAADFEAAGKLFREYAEWLQVDLCFQGFERELKELPVQYGPPAGGLVLMEINGTAAGCAGVRQWQEGIAELKRMYLPEAARGKGLGKLLLNAALTLARELKYERIRLDTLPRMERALALYRNAGFKPIDPYRVNPEEGVIYLEMDLNAILQTQQ